MLILIINHQLLWGVMWLLARTKEEDEELPETSASGRKEYRVPSPVKWEQGASISYPFMHHPLPNHLQTHSAVPQYDTTKEELLDDLN